MAEFVQAGPVYTADFYVAETSRSGEHCNSYCSHSSGEAFKVRFAKVIIDVEKTQTKLN